MPAVAELAERLADADPAVREQAAWELGNLGPAAAPAATALAQSLADESLRSCASWALVKIGGPAVEALIGVLDHESPQVRRAAVSTLWKIAPERAPVVVGGLNIALGDRDDRVRAHAAWALGEIGRSAAAATEALTAAIGDSHPLVRQRAAEALGRAGEPSLTVVSGLTDALRDGDGSVRRAAALGLQAMAATHRAATLRSALPTLDRLARQSPRAERAPFREAAAAIRVNAPEQHGRGRSREDTLPRPAAGPDHVTYDLPGPASPPDSE
jgi:HEAT repeat protein